jgi:hypothetical protein
MPKFEQVDKNVPLQIEGCLFYETLDLDIDIVLAASETDPYPWPCER